MTQMIPPWWPRTTSCGSETVGATASKSSQAEMNETQYHHHHHHHRRCCLSKFVRKLRRQSRTMLQCGSIVGSRKVQCKGTGYDPLSYSLNFDDSRRGCGSGDNGLLDEEDYYRFCALTSRIVNATVVPSTTSTPRVVLVPTSH